jgi:sulfur-oxidizing protein SoxY
MGTTRREFLVLAGGLAGGFALSVTAGDACATPETMQEAIRKLVGNATIRPGRVRLDLPPLIDNGNAVPMTVTVESPMTATDHVKAIHVVTEKNPLPNVVSLYLGPRAGHARVSTRVRLADTQTVTAIAELSDGTFWSDSVPVVVVLSACLEEGPI